jgi:hypothetical protein
VTITNFAVEKVQLPGQKGHKQRALVLFVQFSGALDGRAAENLTGYTVFSGKTKKVHKVPEVLYNKFVPLTEATYNSSADTVILVPRGKHKLPKLEQLQLNVSVLTDPMGRSINNGKNFAATLTHTGFVLSTAGNAPATAAPAATAIDALFERGVFPSVRAIDEALSAPGSRVLQ